MLREISILPNTPRVGSDQKLHLVYPIFAISIHAPRVGSDTIQLLYHLQTKNFNPRSPCGERLGDFVLFFCCMLFQSTLPVWGATSGILLLRSGQVKISIHAPRVGSDGPLCLRCCCHSNFNPRSPCGERRCADVSHRGAKKISIHAPRVGSDALKKALLEAGAEFQSTLPVWGATIRSLC